MPGLRKVPQVMCKPNEMSQQVPYSFFVCSLVLSFLFRFLFFLFLFLFFYVTEGEKQGRSVDSVYGMIKRKMSIFFVSVFFT